MTLAMLHIDRARTRLPMGCTVFSMLVVSVFVALGFMSWLFEKNVSTLDSQGAKSVHVPQMAASAKSVANAEQPDSDETDSWVMHGREF